MFKCVWSNVQQVTKGFGKLTYFLFKLMAFSWYKWGSIDHLPHEKLPGTDFMGLKDAVKRPSK